jgi:hypothetical protein
MHTLTKPCTCTYCTRSIDINYSLLCCSLLVCTGTAVCLVCDLRAIPACNLQVVEGIFTDIQQHKQL